MLWYSNNHKFNNNNNNNNNNINDVAWPPGIHTS